MPWNLSIKKVVERGITKLSDARKRGRKLIALGITEVYWIEDQDTVHTEHLVTIRRKQSRKSSTSRKTPGSGN